MRKKDVEASGFEDSATARLAHHADSEAHRLPPDRDPFSFRDRLMLIYGLYRHGIAGHAIRLCHVGKVAIHHEMRHFVFLPKREPIRMKACPDPDCKAANPSQRSATDDLADRGEGASWTKGAQVCGYCGCVYVGGGSSRRIMGYLDNPLVGPGWQPNKP
ncbi:hypothetical protein IVA84_08620 [Bradyrhizobium sp. 144]|nr:hypothetical protein [Bradyrhizobium sp. 144]